MGRMVALARVALRDAEPELHKGVRVGYLPRERRRTTEDAPRAIVEAWLGPDHPDVDNVIGLLRALCPEGISIRGLRAAAKVVYPDAWEDVKAFCDAHCEVTIVPEFGVERTALLGGEA